MTTRILLGISILILLTVGYNIYDNNRIVVKEQTIKIDNLPDSFNGFKILQISDLHGKRFGEKQKYLLEKINSCKYDIIAITGDMQSTRKQDPEPFFEMLDGIKNKTQMFYTPGNTGPWGYSNDTGIKTNIGEKLEKKGISLLNKIYSLKRGNDRLWFSETWDVEWIDISLLDAQKKIKKQNSPKSLKEYKLIENYLLSLKNEFNKINTKDIKIGVTHYPFVTDRVASDYSDIISCNLLLAGHYHGGQFRIPFYGAFYVPDPTSKTKGFFPEQDKVCGLKNFGSFQQYVSRGLGASGSISIFEFRLFNTPEVDLITFVK